MVAAGAGKCWSQTSRCKMTEFRAVCRTVTTADDAAVCAEQVLSASPPSQGSLGSDLRVNHPPCGRRFATGVQSHRHVVLCASRLHNIVRQVRLG